MSEVWIRYSNKDAFKVTDIGWFPPLFRQCKNATQLSEIIQETEKRDYGMDLCVIGDVCYVTNAHYVHSFWVIENRSTP